MLWEERMEEAARCRDRGNAAYKASNSGEAMTQYLMVRSRGWEHGGGERLSAHTHISRCACDCVRDCHTLTTT